MVLWLSVAALAQDVTGGASPEINAQTFAPSIDGKRLLWVEDASHREDGEVTGRLLFHYTDDPLVYVTENGETQRLVSSVLQADVMGGVTLGPARFGVRVPLLLRTGSSAVGDETGLGDIGLDAKLSIGKLLVLPFDLGVNARIGLPTSTVDAALGSPTVGWEMGVVGSKEIGRVLLAANVATSGGPAAELENVAFNDFFVARLGGSVALHDNYGAGLEFSSHVPYTEGFSNAAAAPLEALASGYGFVTDDVAIRGGIGTGLTAGVGSPDFRLILGVGYEPKPEPPDTDFDGIVDDIDSCPSMPEDVDAFEDEDGCPDPDNDGDGIADASDECVNDAEDADGWQDADGCPEASTLLTVVAVDEEAQTPLDVAKIEATCGDLSLQGTGEVSSEMEPTSCELSATAPGYETASVTFAVQDGPPIQATLALAKKREAKIVITRDRIELKETILFASGKAAIRSASFGLLDDAVALLEDYPEIKLLRIEGHTDAVGSASYNLTLSKQRAASVLDYFVDKGIASERLKSEGFGEERPLDPANNRAAYEKNRRVDFFIEVWDDGTEAPSEEE